MGGNVVSSWSDIYTEGKELTDALFITMRPGYSVEELIQEAIRGEKKKK